MSSSRQCREQEHSAKVLALDIYKWNGKRDPHCRPYTIFSRESSSKFERTGIWTTSQDSDTKYIVT